jgi:hypothetical protein
VYREVKIIKETAAASKKKPSDAVAVVSYDEKPGIQAIATTGPDLPPEPGVLDRGAAACQVKGRPTTRATPARHSEGRRGQLAKHG